jgi:hypothetical protein
MTTILNYFMIKKVLIVLPFYLFTFLPLSAQTYTQRIQQQNGNGQGTVTIHQDADIDKLVNSEVLNNNTKQTTTANQPAASHTPTTPGAKTSTNKPATPNSVTTGNEGEDETTPDLSKKVMRGGVKVSGYRVQAFAGGNSRNDRIQAERIGNNIKSHFANVPVYVHFYSPRWICRVGNYRTYEEAHQMLVQLRNLGYNQASIVKGKITVQY